MKKLSASLFLVLFLFVGITPASADDFVEPPAAIRGTVTGTGTIFAVSDSEYLNVTLQSSVVITVQIESVPSMVVMHLEASEGATSTEMSLSGFAPSTTYYKYENNYHNKEMISTDGSGTYTWVQDLSAPCDVWFQSNPSTKFIKDNSTGGSCTAIGTWDSSTKTCSLTTDVYETIQIDSDNVTLDGNGHTVQGGWGA